MIILPEISINIMCFMMSSVVHGGFPGCVLIKLNAEFWGSLMQGPNHLTNARNEIHQTLHCD